MLQDTASAAIRVVKGLAQSPERTGIAIRGAWRLTIQLLRDPLQFRYLHRWTNTIGRTTLDLELPWLPFSIIDRLDAFLGPTSRAFEYGGGGSTLWIARRAGEVVTAEHDPAWHAVLRRRTEPLPHVTLLDLDIRDGLDDYVSAIDSYPDSYFDLVVVDGRERVRCFERALPKIRAGGVLVLDDSERDRYAQAFHLAGAHPHVTARGLAPCKSKAGQATAWFPTTDVRGVG